jgi:precorrin-6B C5,15-methyltransferase / cobalt-precorrin-6B C5,C15-methyltransferase
MGERLVITVIGMDGTPLGVDAAKALAGASLVVGGRRHLAVVDVPPGARAVMLGDLAEGIDALAAHDGDAVVLASGDPGFFGIVRALRRCGLAPMVLPAVSSVARAFARAGLPWDDALVVSAHGRDPRPAVNACRAHPKVAVFTMPGTGPAELGRRLAGVPRRFVVAERLGAGDERVVECTPAQAASRAWRDPNLVLVLGPDAETDGRRWMWPAAGAPGGWALGEPAFDHRDSMVTKAEVRALVLARLGPRPGSLVWDVGAGCGSVAVECARFGAAVVAVERDADQCARIAVNARRHGVDVAVADGEAPGVLGDLPDPDAVFVGGGGRDVVASVADRRPVRIVVAVAAVERVGVVAETLHDAGYAVDGTQLQASRLARLPDGTHRLAATNPVTVLWGERR